MPQFPAATKYTNVALKAASAPGHSAEPYPFRDVYGYIKQLFDVYGPQRLLWGTDITLFTEDLAWLEGRGLEQVTGCAVCDWISGQR